MRGVSKNALIGRRNVFSLIAQFFGDFLLQLFNFFVHKLYDVACLQQEGRFKEPYYSVA